MDSRPGRHLRLRPRPVATGYLHHRAAGTGGRHRHLRRPCARRRRTIPTDQLTLALGGHIDQAYAVSFIVTNIPTYDNSDDGELITDIEHWFRHRTDIEERIRDAKHGAALRHLPSGKPGAQHRMDVGHCSRSTSQYCCKQSPASTTTAAATVTPARRTDLHPRPTHPPRQNHHLAATAWPTPAPQVLARIRELPTPA